MIYIFGFNQSRFYKHTTSFKISKITNFKFINSLKDLKINNDDVLIRYGETAHKNTDLLFRKVLNKSENIEKSKNKCISSLLLKQHNIPIPEIFFIKSDIIKKDLPVLRRLKYHSRGTDIILIKKLKDLTNGDYYSKFIKTDLEYRVHVFNNEAIRIQKKVPKKGIKKTFIHNFENGYLLRDNFEHNLKLERNLISLSISSIKAIGLDFGAVDILISKERKPYVLEVNSAPRLNKYGRQLYSLYFLQYLGLPFDLTLFPRVKLNEGRYSNGLPIRFREIIKNEH